jgi:hypothetical protein
LRHPGNKHHFAVPFFSGILSGYFRKENIVERAFHPFFDFFQKMPQMRRFIMPVHELVIFPLFEKDKFPVGNPEGSVKNASGLFPGLFDHFPEAFFEFNVFSLLQADGNQKRSFFRHNAPL